MMRLSAVDFGLIYSDEALNLPKAGRCMYKVVTTKFFLR